MKPADYVETEVKVRIPSVEALGFRPVLAMEKFRSLWRGMGLEACLDETPFGGFIELEGERQAIQEAFTRLGLEASAIERRSYPELFLSREG
jgi:adenylate cyclase class 2